MSARPRNYARHRSRRARQRQHKRTYSSQLFVDVHHCLGFWSSPDDLLQEYAKAGYAGGVRAFLAGNPATRARALAEALTAAQYGWRDVDAGEQHRFIDTFEVLLAAGADASVLPAEVLAVLPSQRAQALAAELPVPSMTARLGSRL